MKEFAKGLGIGGGVFTAIVVGIIILSVVCCIGMIFCNPYFWEVVNEITTP